MKALVSETYSAWSNQIVVDQARDLGGEGLDQARMVVAQRVDAGIDAHRPAQRAVHDHHRPAEHGGAQHAVHAELVDQRDRELRASQLETRLIEAQLKMFDAWYADWAKQPEARKYAA